MPKRRKSVKPVGACRPGIHPIRGAGFFDDAGAWFQKAWTGTVKPLLKKTKVLSKIAPIVGSLAGAPGLGATAGTFLDSQGYGYKKRGALKRLRGGGNAGTSIHYASTYPSGNGNSSSFGKIRN